MQTLGRLRGWLFAPVFVAVTGIGLVVYGLTAAGSGNPTHVLGVSIKPAAAGGNSNGNNGNGGGNSGPGNPAKTFAVGGSVSGLTPTTVRSIPLRIANPNNQAIKVTSVTATASGGSSTCPASLLLLGSPAHAGQGSLSLALVIDANGSTTAVTDPAFPITLSATAPDACQNYTWTLSYSGTAVKA